MSPIQADKIMLGSGRQKRNQSRGKVVEPRAKSIGRARETLNRHGMIDKGDRIIVAVSGGPDSVCLLDILHRLREEMGIELLVAHFDHGLRPREDEAETRFVHDLALSMGLSFESEKGRLTAETGGVSIEEKARDARYAFLEDLSNRHQAKKIAVGHTLNDQAETVIMRLLRGSSRQEDHQTADRYLKRRNPLLSQGRESFLCDRQFQSPEGFFEKPNPTRPDAPAPGLPTPSYRTFGPIGTTPPG